MITWPTAPRIKDWRRNKGKATRAAIELRKAGPAAVVELEGGPDCPYLMMNYNK